MPVAVPTPLTWAVYAPGARVAIIAESLEPGARSKAPTAFEVAAICVAAVASAPQLSFCWIGAGAPWR